MSQLAWIGVWTEDQVLVSALEACDRFLAAVRGAVVDDHEHASGLAVRLGAHELLHELVERDDPVLGVAAVKQLRAARVPGGEIAERAASVVLMLDALAARDRGGGGQCGVFALAGLDRGFLVATDDVVARVQQLAFPAAGVEVEDPAGLGGEVSRGEREGSTARPGRAALGTAGRGTEDAASYSITEGQDSYRLAEATAGKGVKPLT